MSEYPTTQSGRDRFILERRGARPVHDPWQAHAVVVEDERQHDDQIAPVATIFLTGRECPWRCVMCDLWRQTTTTDTPDGAIPAQIKAARATLPDNIRVFKLYNAGCFFDPRAVPDVDYAAIAAALDGASRIIVESHPKLLGVRVARFLDALQARAAQTGIEAPVLEIAMGLETACPSALEQLHKGISVEDFVRSAETLWQRHIDLRVFLLVSPPFVPRDEQDDWLIHSVDVAAGCNATAISLIATRSGNGALEALTEASLFHEPTLTDIERSLSLALALDNDARICADLWDVDRFATCTHCLSVRRARLMQMNLNQRDEPPVGCLQCGGSWHQ